MTSSHTTPHPPLPTTPEEMAHHLEYAYRRGLDFADGMTGMEKFDMGFEAGGFECVQRLVECYGISDFYYHHSNPEAEFDEGPFHKAQASAYHTVALTMLVHELRMTPEEAILWFERMLFALSHTRVGTENMLLFPYTPTGLCDGSAERTEPDDCNCGGNHGGDTLTVKPDTEILAHLRASYDQLEAADMVMGS